MAYFNKVQFVIAVQYLDKVLSRWGRRSPTKQLSIMAKVAYDLLIIMLRLHSVLDKRDENSGSTHKRVFRSGLAKKLRINIHQSQKGVHGIIGRIERESKIRFDKPGRRRSLLFVHEHLFVDCGDCRYRRYR